MHNQNNASSDYGKTVLPTEYVSGIMIHIWLAAMYEIMIQTVIREVKELLTKNTFSPQQPLLILDIGCGPGHFTVALCHRIAAEIDPAYHDKIKIIGLDKSEGFISFANSLLAKQPLLISLLTFTCVDIITINSAENQAHIITTAGFFHHFTEAEKYQVMEKIASCLVPNGLLIDGDEHPAPERVYQSSCVGKFFNARQASLFALYLQVIDGAVKVGHSALLKAEIENLFAEIYRDRPEGPPQVETKWLIEMVGKYAGQFMKDLISSGIQNVSLYTELIMAEIERESQKKLGSNKLFDRGDFKDCVQTHCQKLGVHGLCFCEIYDTGSGDLIGSAPVITFRKEKK